MQNSVPKIILHPDPLPNCCSSLNKIRKGNYTVTKMRWKFLEPATLPSRETSLGTLDSLEVSRRPRPPEEAPRGDKGDRKRRNWEGTIGRLDLCYSSVFGGVHNPWKLWFPWLPKSQPHLLVILIHISRVKGQFIPCHVLCAQAGYQRWSPQLRSALINHYSIVYLQTIYHF